MAAEAPNPIHEDDRKLFVGGLPQVKERHYEKVTSRMTIVSSSKELKWTLLG